MVRARDSLAVPLGPSQTNSTSKLQLEPYCLFLFIAVPVLNLMAWLLLTMTFIMAISSLFWPRTPSFDLDFHSNKPPNLACTSQSGCLCPGQPLHVPHNPQPYHSWGGFSSLLSRWREGRAAVTVAHDAGPTASKNRLVWWSRYQRGFILSPHFLSS